MSKVCVGWVPFPEPPQRDVHREQRVEGVHFWEPLEHMKKSVWRRRDRGGLGKRQPSRQK